MLLFSVIMCECLTKKQSKSTHPVGKKLNVGASPHKNLNQKIKVGTPQLQR